jgi:hypothetical protein
MFRQVKETVYVDAYAMELYLPYDYAEKSYRGYDYYQVVGTTVKFFCVGNMRFFENEKQLDTPDRLPSYTIGVPMVVTSIPSEIDTRDVVLTPGSYSRKMIVLRYFKDDIFIENMKCLQTPNNAMILLNRLESGKLDHITPDEAAQILQDVQSMNKANLKIPSEEEEMMIAERYRDRANPSKKARMREGEITSPDELVSLNMRQEAQAATTYQAITHEDINTSLITSINRYDKGIVDEPTIMEKVVRHMDMSKEIEERDKRYAEEAKERAENVTTVS